MANPQQNGFILQRTMISAVTESPLFFLSPKAGGERESTGADASGAVFSFQ
jgi:hypothetical protein